MLSFLRFPRKAEVLALALGFGILLWALRANRIENINDEGIYLEGALRILNGQVPYRDFFVLAGPGTFWLVALEFRLFGMSLPNARLVTILDLAGLAAAVYWIAGRRANRSLALVAAILFFALEVTKPGAVTVNHRWDSSAWAVAAVVMALIALHRASALAWTLAGLLAAGAAWITPPAGLVAASLGVFLLMQRMPQRFFLCYVAGGVALSAMAVSVLSANSAVPAFVKQAMWATSHYAGANHVPYGYASGSYSECWVGVPDVKTIMVLLGRLFFAMPAILPFLVFFGSWRLLARSGTPLERQSLTLLFAASGALLLSAYPRLDLGHLSYASPLIYALAAWLLATCSARSRTIVCTGCLIFAAPFLQLWAENSLDGENLKTRVGVLRGAKADASLVDWLARRIESSASLFVFPYSPMFYVYTGAQNATSYSFLQPGMSSDQDERAALSSLEQRPPRWVIYMDVQPEAYLRIWPGSDPRRLRMHAIETFLRTRYQRRDSYFHPSQGEWQLLELRLVSQPDTTHKIPKPAAVHEPGTRNNLSKNSRVRS